MKKNKMQVNNQILFNPLSEENSNKKSVNCKSDKSIELIKSDRNILKNVHENYKEKCNFGVTTTKGRKYFFSSVCNICRSFPAKYTCNKCKIIYYCSKEHSIIDHDHQQFCEVVQEIANQRGGYIYNGILNLSPEEFRTYRVLTLNLCQNLINDQLLSYEKEAILFPKLCAAKGCGEYRNENLKNCIYCGEVANCKNKLNHFNKSHFIWCNFFSLLRKINMHQEMLGIILPNFPNKILEEELRHETNSTFDKIFKLLDIDFKDEISYAMSTLAASGPLTSWYALKLTKTVISEELIIHIIGAEMEFEVDLINKWETFFMHLLPKLKNLTLIFIGPELHYSNSFDKKSIKLKLCTTCKKRKKIITLLFEQMLYHEFCNSSKSFVKPNLICFYNPGLHRSTGFQNRDTWPLTIKKAASAFCPIVITSYTKFESPLDLQRFLNYSNRSIEIVQPPSVNIFKSGKPERNFISDETVPIIFKNFYSFILK